MGLPLPLALPLLVDPPPPSNRRGGVPVGEFVRVAPQGVAVTALVGVVVEVGEEEGDRVLEMLSVGVGVMAPVGGEEGEVLPLPPTPNTADTVADGKGVGVPVTGQAVGEMKEVVVSVGGKVAEGKEEVEGEKVLRGEGVPVLDVQGVGVTVVEKDREFEGETVSDPPPSPPPPPGGLGVKLEEGDTSVVPVTKEVGVPSGAVLKEDWGGPGVGVSIMSPGEGEVESVGKR